MFNFKELGINTSFTKKLKKKKMSKKFRKYCNRIVSLYRQFFGVRVIDQRLELPPWLALG